MSRLSGVPYNSFGKFLIFLKKSGCLMSFSRDSLGNENVLMS